MAGSTTVYDIPYYDRNDDPNDLKITQPMAEAMEAALLAVGDSGGSSLRLMAPTANQSITTNVETKLNLWANRPDNGDDGSLVSYSAGDFTVVKAGYYELFIDLPWTSNASSYRDVYLYVNAVKDFARHGVPSSGGSSSVSMKRVMQLDVGDVFYYAVKQNSGSSLNVFGKVKPTSGYEDSAYLDIRYLGA